MTKIKRFLQNFYSKLFAQINESSEDLLNQADMSKSVLIKSVERLIPDSACDTNYIDSNFVSLGGSNNLGFLIHQCKSSNNTYISKIAHSSLLVREKQFLRWHQNTVEVKNAFAVPFVSTGFINQANQVECLITEKLDSVKKPSTQQVIDLYKRSSAGKNYFSDLNVEKTLFAGGSRIRDVLLNLVACKDNKIAAEFLKSFMLERIKLMPQSHEVLLKCLNVLNENYEVIFANVKDEELGFVHGDFKASNMLQTDDNSLRLIDFQYYCLGYREWDIAFYLSKSQQPFNKALNDFNSVFPSKRSLQRFAFFYIIANLLHPKPERFIKLFRNKINPALLLIQQLKSD